MSNLMSDVLAFLRLEHQADTIALEFFNKGVIPGVAFTEADESMKTYRAREALIARLSAVMPPEEQTGAATICGHPECDNDSVFGECSRSPPSQ